MKKAILVFLIVAMQSASVFAQRCEPSWESLNQRGYPQWFSDAKLGIFVHWGLYSVPAYAGKEGYAEWFYRGLMTGDPGRKRIMSLYADTLLPLFDQYAELTKYWHAELWNPDEWARMFKECGARYVMFVTKHHDGYCLWDSPQQPKWNSTVSGPYRDIVGELTDAVRRQGMRMCFYYSLPEWTNPRHIWMQDADDDISDYVENYMIPQFKDLVSRYKPDAIFADGDWQNDASQFHAEEIISWYYNTVGPDAIVNDRWGRGTKHGFRTPEYSSGILDTLRPWAECRGVGRSFGLNRNEDLCNYLTVDELIRHFCELVARGGGLTLNVGPYADGTIPLIQQERLSSLGKWLKINGEAIFDSHPWSTPYIIGRSTAHLPDSRSIDFDWVRNSPMKVMPVDNFEIKWEGDIQVPEEGDYILSVEGDDEVAVTWHDGERLLYFNHAWAENDDSKKRLHLSAGILPLTVHYKEKDLEATVRLTWSRDDGKTFEPVPADWRGTATWERTTSCFTQRDGNVYVFVFERPGQSLELYGLPHIDKGSTVSLLGVEKSLKWKQKRDGRVIVDLKGIPQKELNALDHAWVIKISNCYTVDR